VTRIFFLNKQKVYLVRGKTYTFVVEGGDNPEIPAKYHPFYITDDPEGGFKHKSANDRRVRTPCLFPRGNGQKSKLSVDYRTSRFLRATAELGQGDSVNGKVNNHKKSQSLSYSYIR